MLININGENRLGWGLFRSSSAAVYLKPKIVRLNALSKCLERPPLDSRHGNRVAYSVADGPFPLRRNRDAWIETKRALLT